MASVDALIIGAGHNGLVAALMLARAGLRVRMLEAAPVVGGACRTEYPFARAPGVGQSTGAYLLGLMPPELMQGLGLSFPLVRRDPHYFLPTTAGRYLLVGADRNATEAQLRALFSERDFEGAEDLFQARIQKPFGSQALARTLRVLLDGMPGPDARGKDQWAGKSSTGARTPEGSTRRRGPGRHATPGRDQSSPTTPAPSAGTDVAAAEAAASRPASAASNSM